MKIVYELGFIRPVGYGAIKLSPILVLFAKYAIRYHTGNVGFGFRKINRDGTRKAYEIIVWKYTLMFRTENQHE